MFIRSVVLYPSLILTLMIGYVLGGSSTTRSATNNTLKMCNQKPLECKFKYDILMYNETGKVPYKEEKKK